MQTSANLATLVKARKLANVAKWNSPQWPFSGPLCYRIQLAIALDFEALQAVSHIKTICSSKSGFLIQPAQTKRPMKPANRIPKHFLGGSCKCYRIQANGVLQTALSFSPIFGNFSSKFGELSNRNSQRAISSASAGRS